MSGRIAAALTTFAVVCASATVFSVGAAGADPPESPAETISPTAPPSSEPPPVEEEPPPQPQPPQAPPSREQPPGDPETREQRESVQPAAARPQLQVTGTFDKPSYRPADLVTIVVRIKNAGPERASGLHLFTSFSNPADLIYDDRQLGDFRNSSDNPGATLEAGATAELTLSGHVGSPDTDTVRLSGSPVDQDGFHVAPFTFSAPLTRTTSHVAGTVFGDRNGNGGFDPGEALAGAEVVWHYGFGGFQVRATTDAQGRFDFGEIPAVRYTSGGGTALGFFFTFEVYDIEADEDNTDQLIRAVPPLNDALHASMAFDKDSYPPGATAKITITLSNSGPIPLVGIVASCNRSGEGPHVDWGGPGWGELAFAGDGATIPVGATRTFVVSEPIPEGFANSGYVIVACDFGYRGADIDNHAFAHDIAEVPGGIAELRGRLLKPFAEPPGEPEGLPGVQVTLVRAGDCPVIGTTTTDADGEFVFTNLQPGPDYHLYFVPPAGVHFAVNPHQVRVIANNPGQFTLGAEQGDAPLPEIPTNPASCTTPPTTTTPAPQASSGSGLAQTGSDMRSLGTMGLLVLLLGSGFVIAGHRRRTREPSLPRP